MLVSGIFSRPTYEALAIDPVGRSHLVVADHVFAPDPAFFSTLPTGASVEIWSTIGDSRVSQDPLNDPFTTSRNFRSATQLIDAIEHRLSRERVGFRLYAVDLDLCLGRCEACARDGLGQGRVSFDACRIGAASRLLRSLPGFHRERHDEYRRLQRLRRAFART